MKCSRLNIPLVTLVLVIATLLFNFIGHARQSPAQDADKSLDIERYPNEPLALVDIKVSEQSVKSKIEVKLRRDDHGLDHVEFKDKDEWFKRVSVRLRNVSGKPIIGLMAYLYFQPPGLKILFRVRLTDPKQLQFDSPLGPGDETDLAVSDQSWKQTAGILEQHGVDANAAQVTFSVETVASSDGLQWHMGRILHRDPDNPNKWIPINKVTPIVGTKNFNEFNSMDRERIRVSW